MRSQSQAGVLGREGASMARPSTQQGRRCSGVGRWRFPRARTARVLSAPNQLHRNTQKRAAAHVKCKSP